MACKFHVTTINEKWTVKNGRLQLGKQMFQAACPANACCADHMEWHVCLTEIGNYSIDIVCPTKTDSINGYLTFVLYNMCTCCKGWIYSWMWLGPGKEFPKAFIIYYQSDGVLFKLNFFGNIILYNCSIAGHIINVHSSQQ